MQHHPVHGFHWEWEEISLYRSKKNPKATVYLVEVPPIPLHIHIVFSFGYNGSRTAFLLSVRPGGKRYWNLFCSRECLWYWRLPAGFLFCSFAGQTVKYPAGLFGDWSGPHNEEKGGQLHWDPIFHRLSYLLLSQNRLVLYFWNLRNESCCWLLPHKGQEFLIHYRILEYTFAEQSFFLPGSNRLFLQTGHLPDLLQYILPELYRRRFLDNPGMIRAHSELMDAL